MGEGCAGSWPVHYFPARQSFRLCFSLVGAQANLGTGAVNLAMDTLGTPDIVAVSVLLVYSVMCCVVVPHVAAVAVV